MIKLFPLHLQVYGSALGVIITAVLIVGSICYSIEYVY
jgi:hypothetical protein